MTSDETAKSEPVGLSPRQQFTYRGRHTIYDAPEYRDEASNLWRIAIAGDPVVVRAFLQEGKLSVVARPLDEDAWQQLGDSRKATETTEPDESAAPITHALPTLAIRAVLVEKTFDSAFYQVKYNVYVPDAGSSEHSHTLYSGDDGVARVIWSTVGGSITVQMSYLIVSGTSGDLSHRVAKHSTWNVVVEKSQGTSYWLDGDVIVPAWG